MIMLRVVSIWLKSIVCLNICTHDNEEHIKLIYFNLVSINI